MRKKEGAAFPLREYGPYNDFDPRSRVKTVLFHFHLHFLCFLH